MIKKTIIIAAIFLFSGTVSAVSDEAYNAFIEANNAYLSTNYSKAIRLYQKAIALKLNSGGVYYNLGNAYYREGKLGLAIASYLKAQRLMPRNADIASNLKTARNQTENRIIPYEVNPALKQFLFLYFKFSLDELLWVSGALFACLFIFLSVYAFVPAAIIKRLAFVIGVFLIITALTAAVKVYKYNADKVAVVVKDKVIVRAGPGKSYASRIELYDGAEMKVLRIEDKWVKIQVAKEKGWISERI